MWIEINVLKICVYSSPLCQYDDYPHVRPWGHSELSRWQNWFSDLRVASQPSSSPPTTSPTSHQPSFLLSICVSPQIGGMSGCICAAAARRGSRWDREHWLSDVTVGRHGLSSVPSSSSTELARPQGRAGSGRPQLTVSRVVSGGSQAQQQALLYPQLVSWCCCCQLELLLLSQVDSSVSLTRALISK